MLFGDGMLSFFFLLRRSGVLMRAFLFFLTEVSVV